MNNRFFNLTALTAAVFMVSACDCGTKIDTTYAAIEIVAPSGTGTNATYDFGTVFAQQKGTLKIVVRNAAKGVLSLSSIEAVDGNGVKIGGVGDASAIFDVNFQQGIELGASEVVEIDANFAPPEADGPVDYKATLVLHAGGTKEGEDTATITLIGRGIPGDCALPAELDFGNVAVDESGQLAFDVTNLTELPVNAIIGDPYSTTGDDAAFGFAPESVRGPVTIESNGSRKVAIDFRPTEAKDYLAFMKAQARAECPEQIIRLSGKGVAQVLKWDPALLDCGYVTPGVQVTRPVTFTNMGSKEINLTQIKTLNVTEFGVVPSAPGADTTKLTVPAATKDASGAWNGGTANLTVFCKPAVLGPRQTSLTFQTGLVKTPTGSITLKVFGGGADIQVTPSPTLNFGKVAYFSNGASYQKKKLTVMNVGTAPSTPDSKANLRLGQAETGFGPPYVVVTPLNADTAPDEFTVTVPATYDPAVGLVAKVGLNAAELMVEVRPQSVGLKEAKIEIFSNDPDEPVVTVKAMADSVVLPPCNYTVTPTTLNFGLIAPPDYRDLAFTIKNNGTNAGDICLLSNLDMAAGSNPFFSLPSGPIDQRELQPGEVLEVKVRVWPQGTTPTGMTPLTGQVNFFLSSDLRPEAAVILNAQLAPSCLTIAPNSLDFGTVQVGCSSQTRTFSIYNTCSNTVTINSFAMQSAAGQPAGGPNCPGTAPCPEFLLVQTPAIPPNGLPLAPGSAAQTFQAKYRPIDFGSDTGAVAISATQNGSNVTYVVALQGVGDTQGKQTDVFTQDAKPKADILLVIDDSGSMSDDQANLAANFGSFIKYAQAAAVDYHIAVIKTEATDVNQFAKFWFGPTHPEKVLTPTTPNVEQKFKDKVMVGATGGTEWEADPALKSLTAPLVNSDNVGFLRNDAALAIVAITDEPDQSPQTSSYYLNGFWNIKGFNRKTMFTFNAIAGFSPSCPGDDGTLAFYVSQTNGVKDDICTPDWSKTLEALGKIAFGFRTNFFMISTPDTSGGIEVKIDGVTVPQVDSRGATVWTYDAVGNSVNFEPMYVPEPGQTLTIEYHTVCYP